MYEPTTYLAAIGIAAFFAFMVPLAIAGARNIRVGGLVTFIVVAGAAALFFLPLSLTLLWFIALIWACVAEPQPRKVETPPPGWSQTPATKVTIDPETLAPTITRAAPVEPPRKTVYAEGLPNGFGEAMSRVAPLTPALDRESVVRNVPAPGEGEPSAWERMHRPDFEGTPS